ncbi:MAG: hypothetical protein JXR89_03375 [Deltaproteobacteria bacterium]|nr:hypothetical protein [Deltaproteobacteria bacterium]
MTTKSGKKAFKNSKSAGSGSKVAAPTPLHPEIDKQKMAAFFSAAGLEGKSDVVDSLKEEEVVVTETETEPVSAVPQDSLSMTEKIGPASAERDEETESPVSFSEPAAPGTGENDTSVEIVNVVDACAGNDNASEKGDELMSIADSGNMAKGVSCSESCSFNLLPVFFILLVAALFWFYYIASTSHEHSEFSRLRFQPAVSENENNEHALRPEKFTPASQGVEMAVGPAQRSGGDGGVAVKDPSFMRAPLPFWQNRKPCPEFRIQTVTPIAEKQKVENVDSFSRAPVPFWRKGKAAVKTIPGLTAASPELTAPSSGPFLSELKSSAVSMDPSFQRAPKPFWKKN